MHHLWVGSVRPQAVPGTVRLGVEEKMTKKEVFVPWAYLNGQLVWGWCPYKWWNPIHWWAKKRPFSV